MVAQGGSNEKQSQLHNQEQTQQPKSQSVPTTCQGCGTVFPSRNQLFAHLKDTDGACLELEDYDEFERFVASTAKGVKSVLLYGYVPRPPIINNGQDAATILLSTIEHLQQFGQSPLKKLSENYLQDSTSFKINRSYGCDSRDAGIVRQDDDTGAITEVLAVKLLPLTKNVAVSQWLEKIQAALDERFSDLDGSAPIRILGRQNMPHSYFNAEMDVTHRRVEYILPVGLLQLEYAKKFENEPEDISYEKIVKALPIFRENHRHTIDRPGENDYGSRPDENVISFFQRIKRAMRSLTTQIVPINMEDKTDVLEKEFHLWKRKSRPRRSKKKNDQGDASSQDGSEMGNVKTRNFGSAPTVNENHRVLKRKRFHNFTPNLMAHNYMVYRRLDRIYHRATLRFEIPCHAVKGITHPFIVVSLNGDMFLTGQVRRIVGLFIALSNGLIDPDIVNCVFDEEYPHLVPTPPAPAIGMVSGEAFYMSFEGKIKAILSPRMCDRYDKGWNQKETLQRVKEWQAVVHDYTAHKWFESGFDESTTRLCAEQTWVNDVLLPWVERAKVQLLEYRKWKQARGVTAATVPVRKNFNSAQDLTTSNIHATLDAAASLPPPLSSMQFEDSSIRQLYATVLHYLRHADKSGLWPMTTLKRQLVMVTTTEEDPSADKDDQLSTSNNEGTRSESLAVAYLKAKSNKQSRSSAYVYAEGQGGASGSFSVGSFPGGPAKQPKSNALFPELVEAAFELERKLCPNREPSSTIAINRNAQFRPHCDSGAGAGQSTSLIVGLGDYTGGELVVEGDLNDIRYKLLEFNGWTQRHWTMPFKGERFSLVWFTPKGCEGLRGIDLDLSKYKAMSSAPPIEDDTYIDK